MIRINVWAAPLIPLTGDFGHASLYIAPSEAHGGAYISWWPTSADGAVVGVPATTQTFGQDVSAEGRGPTDQVEIEGLDEAAMHKSWEYLKQNGRYALLFSNCSTTVADILRAGGANNSFATQLFYSTTAVWQPNDIAVYGTLIDWNIETIKKNLLKSSQKPDGSVQRHAFMRNVNEALNFPMAARSGLGQIARSGNG